MSVPKTAVIGATGMIGSALLGCYRENFPDVVGTFCHQSTSDDMYHFDLLDPDFESLMLKEKEHEHVMICAGISKIQWCEENQKEVREITDGIKRLIEYVLKQGMKPIFISSDIVFDGKKGDYSEEDQIKPLNEYAKHKSEVEEFVVAQDKGLVLRFTKVFTLNESKYNIFDEMALLLKKGNGVRAAVDQIFSPTLLMDNVKAVLALQKKDASGIIHVSSPERWSRYELAVKMANLLNVSDRLVQKISLDDLNECFVRPKNTTLSTSRLMSLVDVEYTNIASCMEKISQRWLLNK